LYRSQRQASSTDRLSWMVLSLFLLNIHSFLRYDLILFKKENMIRVNNINDHEKPAFTFSILTYNCLASNLAEPKYFPYTNPAHLDFSYRSKLFERELQSLNAHIICLQEMCKNDFQQWLNPFLSRLGYGDGCFAERGGSRAKDGVVIFFKQDKFKLLKQHRLSYFDSAQKQFPTQPTLATYNAALFCLLEIQNTERVIAIFCSCLKFIFRF